MSGEGRGKIARRRAPQAGAGLAAGGGVGTADAEPPAVKRPGVYESLGLKHVINATGTFVMLETARRLDVQRFIYVASSSCYGITNIYPTPESAPADPRYPYALTKYLGEQLVLHWAQVYRLPAVSVRLFNVYGPRARTTGTYGAVFGVFLAQLLAGKPLTIVGDGNQTRDFTYVSDVVDALLTVAASDKSGRSIMSAAKSRQYQ
jgi:UDP-glucose 4-epimerase